MQIRICDRPEDVNYQRAHELLLATYWANTRTMEEFQIACRHSICFSLYADDVFAGFARVVTDYSTMFYIGDVIIAPEYRGQGLATRLMGRIMEVPRFSFTLGMLLTDDAHGLYKKFGFIPEGDQFMSVNKH